jgi:hypothetical protein
MHYPTRIHLTSSEPAFKLRKYVVAGEAASPIHALITEAHPLFSGNTSVVSLMILMTGNPGIMAFLSAGGERPYMHNREQRLQEIERRIGKVGINSRSSVEHGIQNDQHGGPVDVAWIVV